MIRGLPDLEPAELLRYSRHLRIPEVGEEGQRRLKAARVLLVGLGGLGSPASMYLAAAGVGTLGLVEPDHVELSNLQRQLLYGQANIEQGKLVSAAARLSDLNPHLEIEGHPVRLSKQNALDLIGAYDIVVDGSDNFSTRYLVNDACVQLGRPDVFGAISRFEGQVSVFWAEKGPCYRCLFPKPPPPGTVQSCAEAGVFGVLPGIVGTLQAAEVLKIILGIGEPLVGRLLMLDILGLKFREVRLPRAGDCPACSETATITELVEEDEACAVVELPAEGAITPRQLATWIAEGRDLSIIDVRNGYEYEFCRLDGSHLLPLPELPGRAQEIRGLPAPVVVLCHHGIRSAQAIRYLETVGFSGLLNLEGGIEAWRRDVDPSMPGY